MNNNRMLEWEETTLEYVKLMLCKKVVILCHKRTDIETLTVARYLQNVFGSNIVNFIEYDNMKSYIANMSHYASRDDNIIVVADMIINEMKNYSDIGKHKRSFIRRVLPIMIKRHENVVRLQVPYLLMEKQAIYDYFVANKDKLNELATKLADDTSRQALHEIWRCCEQNDIWRFTEGVPDKKYWECYRHLEDEVWINCGAATGDTIVKYAYINNYHYSRIYAYEGGAKEFQDLSWTVGKLRELGFVNIHCINEFIGIDEHKENFDHRYANKRVTLINMDIEGAEMGVLRGAREIIKKWRPVLAICAYHKPTDLFDIPELVWSVAKDYKIYLRKYRSGSPLGFNEYLYYAVPMERTLA
ncbi:MAG: FkbM family methyltransferase [Selenomonadaceae bacterium]|nr:FkbM family methyltransferase [Selenomonadaceae bacterium]